MTKSNSENTGKKEFYHRFNYLPIPESSQLKGKVYDGDDKQIDRIDGLKKVNIYIGPNNSGKSYILREIWKQHLNWQFINLISEKEQESIKYFKKSLSNILFFNVKKIF